jgi:hypothetical protein
VVIHLEPDIDEREVSPPCAVDHGGSMEVDIQQNTLEIREDDMLLDMQDQLIQDYETAGE